MYTILSLSLSLIRIHIVYIIEIIALMGLCVCSEQNVVVSLIPLWLWFAVQF